MYVAFIWFMLGLKVPVPLVDQKPVVAPPETDPDKVAFALLAQTLWFEPAFATPAGKIFNRIVSLTAKQLPLLLEVKIKLTPPSTESCELAI